MVVPTRRRVSYVIPPPQTGSIPRLQLPPLGISRLGSILPLLIPLEPIAIPHNQSPHAFSHPKHRLPVASLALDSTTYLVGKPSPEGILYTGGRDGMVISWDLHLPTRRLSTKHSKPQKGRWEMLTGWGDDWFDDGEEDTENEPPVGTDGDVLGDVTASARKRRKSSTASDKGEHWELDPGEFIQAQVRILTNFCCNLKFTRYFVAFGVSTVRTVTFGLGKRHPVVQPGSDKSVTTLYLVAYPSSVFVQVVSASSDGTLKAWNPHAAADPTLVGSHSDYVRCLAHWYLLFHLRICSTNPLIQPRSELGGIGFLRQDYQAVGPKSRVAHWLRPPYHPQVTR